MSGTDDLGATYADAIDRLEAVLDRRVPMEPLNALTSAVNSAPRQQVELARIAIGFDSSVFLRMSTHPKSADILDYLPRHNAPLILPGQAIQEFWNNRLSVVQTVSSSVRRKFEQLAEEAKKVDAQFGEFEKSMTAMLTNFESQFGYVYDENTMDSVSKMLAILQERAHCCFAPRGRFNYIAQIRKRTKTPPGFKDDGDGDFFLWTDFLLGLLMCSPGVDGGNFEQVVLLTNDKKPDWSTRGTPHPILSAEVHALFKTPFELWDVDAFATRVEGAV